MDFENTNFFLINDLYSYSELRYKARNYKVKTLLSDKIQIDSSMNDITKKIINGLDFSNDAYHKLCTEHAIPQSLENEAITVNENDINTYVFINAIENQSLKLGNRYKDIFYKYGLESNNCDPQYFYTKLFYRYFLGYEYLPISARNKQKKTKELIEKANVLEAYLANALTDVLTNHGFECTPSTQFRNIDTFIIKKMLFDSLNNNETIEFNLYNDIINTIQEFSKTKENHWTPSLPPKEQLRRDVCEMNSAKYVSENTGIPLDYLYKMINGQKPITTKNLAKIYSFILRGNPSAYEYIYYISGEETQRKINNLYFKAIELAEHNILNYDLPVEKLVNNNLFDPSYKKISIAINDKDCNNVYGINFDYVPLLDALNLLGNNFYGNKLQTGLELTSELFEDLLKEIKPIKKYVLSEYKDLIRASTTTYYDVYSKDGKLTITRNTNQIKKFIKLI